MDGTTRNSRRFRAQDPSVVIDLSRVSDRLDDTRVVLDAVAADLRDLWSDVVAGGDFTTLNRLVEASHAIHRAAVALGDGPIVPSRSDPVPPGPTVVEGLSPAHAQARRGRGYDTMTEEIQK